MAYTLTYKLINNGTEYEVSGYTYTGDYSEVVIPNEYEGLPVTSIGNAAFQGCGARIIKIPDSVTNISTSAFYNCTNANDIVIPSSVTNIGNYAFDNCVNLTSIEIPDSVTSIGSAVFDDCSRLKSITVSTGNANYKSIDGNLYTKDGKLLVQYAIGKTATSFTIPNSVTSIGSYAIKACSSLTSIEIPDSVTSISNGALSGCSRLTSITVSTGNANYKSIDGNLYTKDGKTLLCYAAGKTATSFTIPDSVTSIGNYAFYNCNSLTSIVIPDSVTSIGDRAFQGCNKLVSVVIPDSVTSIGDRAFQGCSSLINVTVPAVAIDYIPKENLQTVIITSGGNIGDHAFQGCNRLTSITIPDSVTSIGYEAFYNCSSLTGVYISDIGAWCNISFENSSANPLCNGAKLYLNKELVTELTIPDNVTNIGSYAFYWCSSLTSVVIPDGVTSIGGSAFYYCSSLTSVVIGDSVTSIGDYAFYWCSSLTSVVIGDNVKSIGSYAFAVCRRLTSVVIGNGVTSIGDYAFRDCSNLTSITIPNSVTSIGDYAFYYCSSLTSVYITDIAAWCNISFGGFSANPLYYARKLYLNNALIKELVIPDGVTSIGKYAFKSCSSLTSIEIPDSVTSIGEAAFEGCNKLVSVVIPDNVTSIGRYAFEDCSSLTSVTIGNSVTSVGNRAFYNCSSLTGVYISDIGAWCNISFENSSANPLYYAKNLYLNIKLVTKLIIPDNVTSIGDRAFEGCSSLTSVVIGDGVTSIGYSAFYNCYRLTSITIPDSVTSIGTRAFYNCTNLTKVTLLAKTPASLLSADTFSSNPTFYCFNEAIEAYKTTTNWNVFANNFVADDMRLYFTMNSRAQKKYFASKEDVTILEQNMQIYIQQYIRDNFATLMAEYLNSAEATDNKPTAADISEIFNENEEA